MSKVLFPLALANLRKNYRLYGPFALAYITSVALLYNFMTLALNPSMDTLRGGPALVTVLSLGSIILAITGAAIIWYANSFVFKQRTKEYGLYGILGLERRHLLSLMTLEITIFSLVASAIGLASGMLVNRLILSLYQRLMSLTIKLDTSFQMHYLVVTVLLTGALYVSLILINSWRILRLKPLQLVRESRRGEKNSRFTWLYALAGIGLMGYGYYLALTITDAVAAIGIFFIAVLLVTAGTYFLFQAGSIVLLRLLQRRKGYYYQPANFISVSNLIFRMRKNGIGLATICLLSSMALVTLSAGISLYVGTEATINRLYPSDIDVVMNYQYHLVGNDPLPTMTEALNQFEQEHQLALTGLDHVRFLNVYGALDGHTFTARQVEVDPETHEVVSRTTGLASTSLSVMDLSEYNRLTGQALTLEPGQALWFHNQAESADVATSPVHLFDQTYTVSQVLDSNPLESHVSDFSYNFIDSRPLLVVPDLDRLQPSFFGSQFNSRVDLFANSQASQAQQLAAADQIVELIKAIPADGQNAANVNVLFKADIRDGYMQMIGSIFFIGIFLAAIFLLGLALTIYYKQISEGLEDADRFEILQKVGLDKATIHRTIRKQIMVVFFAPIVLALCHLAGAFHMMSLILRLISAMKVQDLLLPTLGTAVVITLFYFLVFLITSRSYEKIVSSKR